MAHPALLILGMLIAGLAGWLIGHIGIGLMGREEEARTAKERGGTVPAPPGVKDYMLGWVLPIVLGFIAYVLGWIGYSGVPDDGGAAAGSIGTALTNRGLAIVLVAEVIGISVGRLPAVLKSS